jgi:hypothetical protein
VHYIHLDIVSGRPQWFYIHLDIVHEKEVYSMRKRYRSKIPGARKETLGNVRGFFYLTKMSYIYSIQKGRYGLRVRNGREERG